MQLSQDIDVYDVLPYASALVSDYSSLIFDFMLLGRPIVYYVPDLEQFKTECRSMIFEPEEVAVGPLCRDSDQLFGALADIANGTARPAAEAERRNTVIRRLHTYVDGEANHRVRDALERRLLGRNGR